MSVRLEGIAIRQFPPFKPQKCRFGEATSEGLRADTHLFVGENGTGKTRLLSLLMAACGNPGELGDRSSEQVLALVVSADSKGGLVWDARHLTHAFNVTHAPADQILELYASADKFQHQGFVGESLLARSQTSTAAMAFRSVAAIRDEKLMPMAAVDWGDPKAFLLFAPQPKMLSSVCQAVANMKIRAGMFIASAPGQDNDRTVRMVKQLEHTLQQITGRQFLFVVEQVGAETRLKVIWGGRKMVLHQLPDGLRAIIGWLANCVARLDAVFAQSDNPLDQRVLMFLDEPETHLHPKWQRFVLPALQRLLPNAQIFVATHSPFVVSSVNAGWLYILKADSQGHVAIDGPKPCSKGDSYIDAVEDVLGLKEWYDPETEGLLKLFREARDIAVKTLDDADKAKMVELASQIAKRSESLEAMMGRELKQFAAKEKAVTQ